MNAASSSLQLESGDHLIEVLLARPCTASDLEDALRARGFTDGSNGPPSIDSTADRGSVDEWTKPPWMTLEKPEEQAAFEKITRFRFVGRIERAKELASTDEIHYSYAHAIPLDVFANYGGDTPKVRMHRVLRERQYHLRFFSWVKTAKGRPDVIALLKEIGFDVQKLSALKRNMGLPGKPNVTCTFWYASCRWAGPDGYVTNQERLFFEDVVDQEGVPVEVDEDEATSEASDEAESSTESPASIKLIDGD